jgi:hypothetical protein
MLPTFGDAGRLGLMATGRRRKKDRTVENLVLTTQLADLELRIRRLEARLRQVSTPSTDSKPGSKASTNTGKKALRTRAKVRPRCPHCFLEIPKGKRTEACVWCGYYFSAEKAVLKRAQRR